MDSTRIYMNSPRSPFKCAQCPHPAAARDAKSSVHSGASRPREPVPPRSIARGSRSSPTEPAVPRNPLIGIRRAA
jgi:hypothetical protein